MSAVSSAASLDPIRILLEADAIANFAAVFSTTIFIYDYLITLDEEVELIMKRPRSPLSVLVFINRYLPFIDTFGMLLYSFGPTLGSVSSCEVTFILQPILFLIGMFASESILIVRSAAVWGNRKYIYWVLVALGFVTVGAVVFTQYKVHTEDVQGVEFLPADLVLRCGNFAGKGISVYQATPWLMALVLETTLICLLLPKAIAQRSFGRTELYDAVYINGFRFYLYAFATSIANIVTIFYPFAPGIHPQYLVPFDRIMHSVLVGRLVFSIRGAARGLNVPAVETASLSRLDFNTLRAQFGTSESQPSRTDGHTRDTEDAESALSGDLASTN